MELSSLTQQANAHVYRGQATPLFALATDLELTTWPAGTRLHAGAIDLEAVLSDSGSRADWSISAELVAALAEDSTPMWIGITTGSGEAQVAGGWLFRHEHGAASEGTGLVERIIIGPTGPSAYQAAVAGGFEGTEAEFNTSVAGLTSAAASAAGSALAAAGSAGSASEAVTAATDARDAAQAARDLAVEAAAHPSDPAVAALIDDPDSQVRASLSSTYVAPTGAADRLQVDGVDVTPAQVGAQPAGSYADLVGGVVPTSQIPAVALTNGQVVASRAALLALSNVQPGDLVVISSGTDKGTYILTASDPSTWENWLLLNAPTDVVQTVNGLQGTVVLGYGDVGAASAAQGAKADSAVQPAVLTPALAERATNATRLAAKHMSLTAFDVVPRLIADNALGVTSGSVYWTMFTPEVDLTVSQITMISASTAGAGLTLARMGIYSFDETTLTLLACTSADTSLFTVANTAYTRSLNTTGGYPATLPLTAGQRYAVGVLVVGTTMPTLVGTANAPAFAPMFALAPKVAVFQPGQSDLPSSTSALATLTRTNYSRLS